MAHVKKTLLSFVILIASSSAFAQGPMISDLIINMGTVVAASVIAVVGILLGVGGLYIIRAILEMNKSRQQQFSMKALVLHFIAGVFLVGFPVFVVYLGTTLYKDSFEMEYMEDEELILFDPNKLQFDD